MKTASQIPIWLVMLSSIFYFFSYAQVDPDLWGHLFFGREILERGKLPLQNLYSYTAPDHPWINHEWLAEIILYVIYKLLGSPGLIIFKVAIGAIIVWIVDRLVRDRVYSPWSRALTLVWVMALLSPGFMIRPQLFTYFLFAVFCFLFYRFERGCRVGLYLTPLLIPLWINLHGGVAAGLGALGVFWACALVREKFDFKILIPFALAVAVLALNPYGFDLPIFLVRDILLDRPITEWRPVPLFDFSFLEFKLALIVSLPLALWKGAWRRWDFTLAILAALFAIHHQRHIPFFAIAAAPFLAEGIESIVEGIQTKARGWILAGGISAAALYLAVSTARIHWEHRFQLVVSPLEYPSQAADFLTRNGFKGNLAAPFDWGEYLIWKLYPEIRVALDGRYTTAYPMEVIRDLWNWMEGKDGWRNLLDHYPTDIAMTSRHHPVTSLLRKDPKWVYIYSDPVAFVFVRRTQSQADLLERFRERRLLPPGPPPIYFPG